MSLTSSDIAGKLPPVTVGDPLKTPIFHITEIANLERIITTGGLLSDARVGEVPHEVIGYDHIKERRLTAIKVPCCGNRFVGEFVPFYYCARSPMLYSVNIGRTGKQPGHQREVVHLCSTIGKAIATGRQWAFSDGNAGAFSVSFYDDISRLDELDWKVINATQWGGQTHRKMAEFLVHEFFPWESIFYIGCHSVAAAARVQDILTRLDKATRVEARPAWYY